VRLSKHKSRNRRRHAAASARTYGWPTFMRWFTGPESAQDAPDDQLAARVPDPDYRPLQPLPSGSMGQRTLRLPKFPARTAYVPREADLDAASRVARSATGRPAYQIATDVPLFRDEKSLTEYEDRYQARLRGLQRFQHPQPDGQGVRLGSDQSPKTITWTTAAYREFAASQEQKPVTR
jgi:hypothetical protein